MFRILVWEFYIFVLPQEALVFQMMMHISILCFISFIPMIVSQLSNDPDQLLNWCLDGKYHKSSPGPEDDLYEQVSVSFVSVKWT
jgi:hypothetical protein